MAKQKSKTSKQYKKDVEELREAVREHIKGLTFLFVCVFLSGELRRLVNTYCSWDTLLAALLDKVSLSFIVFFVAVLLYKLLISVLITCQELRRIQKEYKE